MKTATTNPRTLTVLICTHNRVDLLSRVIHSLNAANPPAGWRVRLFVVANRHLPYEQSLNDSFGAVRVLAERDGFKLIEAIRAGGR